MNLRPSFLRRPAGRGVCVVACLAGGIVQCLAGAAAEPATRPVAVSLEDQFRNPRDTARLVGDVVVLVYAERNGAEASHDLGRRLHVHFHPTAATVEGPEWGRQPVVAPQGWPADRRPPDVHAVAVACLPEIPRALHPVVRAQVRKESPYVPVWLDFNGVMPRQFGLEDGVPNVLLVDTRGHAQGVVRGQVDELRYRELVTAIDRLRVAALAQPALATAGGQPGGVQPASGTVPGRGGVVPAGGPPAVAAPAAVLRSGGAP